MLKPHSTISYYENLATCRLITTAWKIVGDCIESSATAEITTKATKGQIQQKRARNYNLVCFTRQSLDNRSELLRAMYYYQLTSLKTCVLQA